MHNYVVSNGRTALLLAGIFSTGCLTTAFAQSRSEALLIQSTQGRVLYSTDHKTWNTLQADQALPQGAVLKTDAHGTADVMLQVSGAALRLGPNTEIELSRLSAMDAGDEIVTQASLNLKSGSVVGLNRNLPPASEFTISTQSGVVTMKGSEYAVQASGDVTCFSGSVSVHQNSARKGGSADCDVSAGQSLNCSTGRVGATPDDFARSCSGDLNAVRDCESHFKPPHHPHDDKHHHHMSPTEPDDDDDHGHGDNDHDGDGDHGNNGHGHGDDDHGNNGHGNDGQGNDDHGNNGHGDDDHGNDNHGSDGHGDGHGGHD